MNSYMVTILAALGTGFILIFLTIYALIHKLRDNEHQKYEFITIIAHKFRTPLTQIKWLSEELSGKETDPYKKESLSEIAKSNENLIKLTGTLIELTDSTKSAKTSYQFERINICEITHKAVEQAKTLFHEKNIFLAISCTEPMIYVRADLARMEYVLSTILENACVYTPTGRNVSVNVVTSGSHVTISVTDAGIGIDKKDIGRLFTKFYRTREAQAAHTEGMGIGLYLALSIVRRHHGKMDAFSEGLGKGSTFSVTLRTVK